MSFQWKEFLLFAALLLGVCIIFSIMAYFYQYVDPDQLDKMYLDDLGKDDDDDDEEVKMKDKGMEMKKKGNGTKL